MSSTRSKLINLLSQTKNDYISGQQLSNDLQISRSAIWKHMNELKKDGYVIEGIPKKGYKFISYPKKVSENTIQWGLNTAWAGRVIYHRESLESTQQLAHQLALEGAAHGTVVIADEQTKGKGRTGRYWESHKDKGVWMSLILRPNILPYEAPQLTLVTATVLATMIKEVCKLTPQIKWPNDVLINGKKIAGILTEMQAEQDQINYVVIGMGLNVNQLEDDFESSETYPFTSLKIESNKNWPLTNIIQCILKSFERKYENFINNGFNDVKVEWEGYGFKINETITLKSGHKKWNGIFLGIAEDGAILVKNELGEIEKIYSAEIMWF